MVHLDIHMENEESYSLPYTMQKSIYEVLWTLISEKKQ